MKSYNTPEITLTLLTGSDVITSSQWVANNGDYMVGAPASWWTGNE